MEEAHWGQHQPEAGKAANDLHLGATARAGASINWSSPMMPSRGSVLLRSVARVGDLGPTNAICSPEWQIAFLGEIEPRAARPGRNPASGVGSRLTPLSTGSAVVNMVIFSPDGGGAPTLPARRPRRDDRQALAVAPEDARCGYVIRAVRLRSLGKSAPGASQPHLALGGAER
jgi:hypothetical protein